MSANDTQTPPQTSPDSFQFPVFAGCPICRKALQAQSDALTCPPCDRDDCPKSFSYVNGFPDLVIGERFEDESSDELIESEENNTEYTVTNYWVPLFKRLTQDCKETPRILALGCGVGREVDNLRNAGFECVGIDNGNRTRVWESRTHKDSLLMANGMHLPFEDNTFDIAFCGCVFPHVGVVGDSFQVTENCRNDRLAIAKEMTRVIKKGGNIIVSSPNRLFPLDLYHGREIGTYATPINPPWKKFLLSKGDYASLFRDAGCNGRARALSIKNYWGFCGTKRSRKGRLLSIPVKALFTLGSNEITPFFRASPLLPWIVVRITK